MIIALGVGREYGSAFDEEDIVFFCSPVFLAKNQ